MRGPRDSMDWWVISTLNPQISLSRRVKCSLSFDTIPGGTPPFQFLITPVSRRSGYDKAPVTRNFG